MLGEEIVRIALCFRIVKFETIDTGRKYEDGTAVTYDVHHHHIPSTVQNHAVVRSLADITADLKTTDLLFTSKTPKYNKSHAVMQTNLIFNNNLVLREIANSNITARINKSTVEYLAYHSSSSEKPLEKFKVSMPREKRAFALLDLVRGRRWDGSQHVIDPTTLKSKWELRPCHHCTEGVMQIDSSKPPIMATLEHLLLECPGKAAERTHAFIRWRGAMSSCDLNLQQEGRNVEQAEKALVELKQQFIKQHKIKKSHEIIVDESLGPEAMSYYLSWSRYLDLEKLKRIRRAEKAAHTQQIDHAMRQASINTGQDPVQPVANERNSPPLALLEQSKVPYVVKQRETLGKKNWLITDDFIDIVELQQFVNNNKTIQKAAQWIALNRRSQGGANIKHFVQTICEKHDNLSTYEITTKMQSTLFSPTGSEHQIIAMATFGAILLEEVVLPRNEAQQNP